MSFNEGKKIHGMLVLEIIGRPKEYLIQTLEAIIKQISEEKGVALKNKNIKEPIELEQKKDLFTTFAEVEVETDNLLYLVMLMFKYMPSHVEIMSPQTLSITNSELNETFNELIRRLHGYEEIARVIQTEKMILENKLKSLMPAKEEERTETKSKKKKK